MSNGSAAPQALACSLWSPVTGQGVIGMGGDLEGGQTQAKPWRKVGPAGDRFVGVCVCVEGWGTGGAGGEHVGAPLLWSVLGSLWLKERDPQTMSLEPVQNVPLQTAPGVWSAPLSLALSIGDLAAISQNSRLL